MIEFIPWIFKGYFTIGALVDVAFVYFFYIGFKNNLIADVGTLKEGINEIKKGYNASGKFGKFILTGVFLFVGCCLAGAGMLMWPYVLYCWIKGE